MNISDYLTVEERQALTRKSDLRGFAVLGTTWLSILAVFALVTTWTNPFTLLLAVILLAGRQLGLAVIMHDFGHNTLFRTRAFNRFFGQWFAALRPNTLFDPHKASWGMAKILAEGGAELEHTLLTGARDENPQGRIYLYKLGAALHAVDDV